MVVYILLEISVVCFIYYFRKDITLFSIYIYILKMFAFFKVKISTSMSRGKLKIPLEPAA